MEKLRYNSSFEGEFVKYYEMYFYHNNEDVINDTIAYIEKIYGRYGDDNAQRTLIDIGCGTGVFEEGFARLFDRVVAADLSRDMLEYAVKNHSMDNVNYIVHNICDSPIREKASIAVALSHVIGYQLSDEALDSFIRNVSLSLNKGGLFVFSFYNKPAILSSQLLPRKKVKTISEVRIERESNTSTLVSEDVLINNYDYCIKDKEEIEIVIQEKMRYFSVEDLRSVLEKNGMKALEVKKTLSEDNLTDNEWNGCIIAIKQ